MGRALAGIGCIGGNKPELALRGYQIALRSCREPAGLFALHHHRQAKHAHKSETPPNDPWHTAEHRLVETPLDATTNVAADDDIARCTRTHHG